MLDVGDVVPGGVPHVLDWVVVGCVGRQEYRGDALELLTRFEQLRDGLGVMETSIIQDNGDLLAVSLPR